MTLSRPTPDIVRTTLAVLRFWTPSMNGQVVTTIMTLLKAWVLRGGAVEEEDMAT